MALKERDDCTFSTLVRIKKNAQRCRAHACCAFRWGCAQPRRWSRKRDARRELKRKKKQVNNRCDEGRDGREMQMCEGELQSSGRVLQQSMTRWRGVVGRRRPPSEIYYIVIYNIFMSYSPLSGTLRVSGRHSRAHFTFKKMCSGHILWPEATTEGWRRLKVQMGGEN